MARIKFVALCVLFVLVIGWIIRSDHAPAVPPPSPGPVVVYDAHGNIIEDHRTKE